MANTERTRLAGMACISGAVLWVVVLLADVVNHQAISASAINYRIWEGFLIVVQALLLVGVVGLVWSGAAGMGGLAKIGFGIALLGRTSFLIGEVRSFARGSDDEIFVPLGALLTGLGMILVGSAVIRARRWEGWHRFTPLLAGIYPFIFMFPLFAIMGTPPGALIALWGLLWLALGVALYAEAGATKGLPRPVSVYS